MTSRMATPRMQITLEPDLQRFAHERAKDKGVSVAEYIRRLIRQDIGEQETQADVSSIFGIGDSGGSDVAHDKHKLIGEAFDEIARKRRKRT